MQSYMYLLILEVSIRFMGHEDGLLIIGCSIGERCRKIVKRRRTPDRVRRGFECT
jgi:hypothetical protein